MCDICRHSAMSIPNAAVRSAWSRIACCPGKLQGPLLDKWIQLRKQGLYIRKSYSNFQVYLTILARPITSRMTPFKGRIGALLVDSHLISSALLIETWKIDLIHKIFKSFTHPPNWSLPSPKPPYLSSHSIVRAHMLICIYAQSQSKYISVFSLILFLYYFHFTVHTLFQFFLKISLFFLPFYSLQKPVTLTWHCWFCFHLSAHVPTRHAESNRIIRNMHAHLGMLSGVEAGARNRVYACKVFTLLLRFSQFNNRTWTRYINQWCFEWQVWGL